jgi:hypothetical protein
MLIGGVAAETRPAMNESQTTIPEATLSGAVVSTADTMTTSCSPRSIRTATACGSWAWSSALVWQVEAVVQDDRLFASVVALTNSRFGPAIDC